MSSGSQSWGQVPGRSLSLASLLLIPPREQLFAAAVEGAVVAVSSRPFIVPLSCEQRGRRWALKRVGVGAQSLCGLVVIAVGI